MKINILRVFLAISCGFLHCTQPTESTYGLRFDDDAYSKHDKVPDIPAQGFGDDLPLQHSLKSYCPKPNDQKKIASCVGQATGYGALTIMEALRDQRTQTDAITASALSALFIYNPIKGNNCASGSTFEDAFEKVLKPIGTVPMQDFEGNQQNCQLKPNPQHLQNALAHRILSYQRLFDLNDRADIKIFKIKKSLAANKPVIVGMKLPENFSKYDGKTPTYTPSGPVVVAHAMVVISYDDKAGVFEILNSAGENWGDKGFFKIKYDDFAQYTSNAYHLILPSRPTPTPNETALALTGHFDFRTFNPQTNQLTSAAVTFNGAYYETDQKNWQVGQRFQLIVNEIKKDKYLYVFSVDPTGKAQIHFPKRAAYGNMYVGLTEGALVPYDDAAIVIPQPVNGENRGLIKEAIGSDWLCILYSEKAIQDNELLKMVQQCSGTGNDFVPKMQQAFGNRLITSNQVGYEPKQMRFKTNMNIDNFIVPVVLKVEAR